MRRFSFLVALALVAGVLVRLIPAEGRSDEPRPQATATGTGGAVATIDPLASATAMDVLDQGATPSTPPLPPPPCWA